MDGQWTLPLKSTIHSAEDSALQDKFIEIFPEHRKSSNNEFMIDQARWLTNELIHRRSYCPATWTARAYNLLRLGYPDLAVGDAYKAKILLEFYSSQGHPLQSAVTKALWRQTKQSVLPNTSGQHSVRDRATSLREYVDRMNDRSSIVFAQALFLANCFIECYEFLKNYVPKQHIASEKFDRLKELAERAQVIEDMSRLDENDFVRITDQDSQEGRRSGSIYPQVYPWSALYIQRGDKILDVAKFNMRGITRFGCYIEESGIVDDKAAKCAVEKEVQTMGVKANKNFPQGELLFGDRTFLSGVDNHAERCSCCNGRFPPHQLQEYEAKCCDAQFCGPLCRDFSRHYHPVVCRRLQDLMLDPSMMLNHANVSPDTIAANNLLYRVLAHLENNPAVHPLRTPAMGSMVPAYRSTSPVRFSWTNDIMRPFNMLRALGTDIFKDHGFDTWVIQTIQARMRNNVRAFQDEWGQYHMTINLLYMFFNHSCEPNIEIVNHWSGSSQLYVMAKRQIKRKEELFISYIDAEDLKLPYADRQKLLRDWTGGECQCQRCQQERNSLGESQQTFPVGPSRPDFSGNSCTTGYIVDNSSNRLTNRYIGDQALIETHPTVQSLKRKNLFHELDCDPLGCDDDVDFFESPTRKKAKLVVKGHQTQST